MIDWFNNIALGLNVAFSFTNLLYCFYGVLLGTLIGVLPGLGPTATIAMLLPITFYLQPETALIMLAGIYYGAQYGGSTAAILVNIPGETSSVVTCLDGHAMAKQGRAGPALGIAAIGSFVAGSVATLLIAAFAPMLASVALSFSAPEYFSLMVLGLVATIVMAQGSVIKALGMIALGILLGTVGMDLNTGAQRYMFGQTFLSDGIDFVVVAMGVFGLGEIMANLDRNGSQTSVIAKISRVFPSLDDIKRAWRPVLRGTAIGSFLGLVPGGGATLSSFASYTVEKRIADDPRRFGNGAVEGLAGPESANNAGAQTSFVPMLTLGIPSNVVMALMIGAMMIQGIAPGPQIMSTRPELFWGIIVSMWLGNLMLVILNMPLIGLWVRLLSIPYRLLFPAIVVICAIGVLSLNNNEYDVLMAAAFGMLGYLFVKLNCEPAPLLLGFILGPLLEENLRRAMLMSRGDATVFFTSPVSAATLVLAAVLLAVTLLPMVRRKREEAFQE